jgi:hypothetical protein
MADKDKKDGRYNFVTSGSDSGARNSTVVVTPSNDKKVISTEEQKQARKFGMTDEEWMKSIEDSDKENAERMANVGGRS